MVTRVLIRRMAFHGEEIDEGEKKFVNIYVTRTKFLLTLFQMFVILIVLVCCILNISFKNGNSEMWVSFLGLAFGAVLPNPKVKKLFSNSYVTPFTSTKAQTSSNASDIV